MEGGTSIGEMGGGASRTGEHWGKTPRPDFIKQRSGGVGGSDAGKLAR